LLQFSQPTVCTHLFSHVLHWLSIFPSVFSTNSLYALVFPRASLAKHFFLQFSQPPVCMHLFSHVLHSLSIFPSVFSTNILYELVFPMCLTRYALLPPPPP
jgi:hypothetical protein